MTLAAAWAAAEAALPEDWHLTVTVGHGLRGIYTAPASYTYSLRHYRLNVGRARFVPFVMTRADTPTAALLALADGLEGVTP